METRSVMLRILGDPAGGAAAINWINAEGDKIDARHPTLKIGADASGAFTKMASLRSAVDLLTGKMNDIKFGASDTGFNATIASMMVKLTALQAIANRPILSDKMLAQSKADVLALAASFDTLMTKQQAATDKSLGVWPLIGKPPGGGAGGGVAGLGSASLFGGIAATSGLHVLIDGAIELAAKLVPATVAALAFGGALVALAPTAEMIYQRETNMYTATDILGQQFPMLTDKLNKFGQLVPNTATNLNALNAEFRPGVVQVWGDALTVASGGAGVLQKLLAQVVPWLDQFAAKVTVDLANGSGAFMKFVEQGAHDLAQFGALLAPIANGIFNLFKIANQTGIANDLLAVLTAGARLFDLLTKLPTPVLVLLASLHGVYLWGGLAFTGISKIAGAIGMIPGLGGIKVLSDLPGLFDKMATAGLEAGDGIMYASVKGMKGLAINADGAETKLGVFRTTLAALGEVPVWGWVAAGVVALGVLGWWLTRSTDETKQFIDGINTSIAKASNAQAFNLMAQDVGQVGTKLVSTNAAMMAYAKSGTGLLIMLGTAMRSSQELGGETQNLTGKMTNFATGTAWIMKTFGVSYPVAIGIATQAGVKLTSNITGNSKAAQDLRQQIFGLMAGLTQLQGPSGIAGKDFEALAIAGNDITTKISQLNAAWHTMVTTVTGPQSSFDTFAQGMTVLSSSGQAFTTVLGHLRVAGTQGKAAIDDLSASGINLNQAFMTETGNLDAYVGTLRTAGASQPVLTTAMKAGVAALIPYAAGSKEATAVLLLMAQEVNGPTTDSIKVLSQWAGVKAPAALGIMKKSADTATTAASNLANTLQNLLNTQFQNDIIKASGASVALGKYTTDLVYNTEKTRAGQTDRQNLINALIRAGDSAATATAYVNGLSTALHKVPPLTYITVKEKGTGIFTITGTGIAASQGPGGSGNAAGGLAEGWRVPGYGGGDKWPALLEGGEAVVPKHLVAPIAPFLSSHGVPGFAAGGITGGSFDGSIAGLPGFTAGMNSAFINDMTGSMESAIANGIQTGINAAIAQAANSGGGGAQQWAGVVHQALGILGLPYGNAGTIISQIGTESGGNPAAINRTDSNWLAGHPSVGLLQVIAGTYARYAGPNRNVGPFAYGVSENPLANIYAGINYAINTYGNPGYLSVLGHGHGYDSGGYLPVGLSLAMNNTGKPELVTPLNSTGHHNINSGGITNVFNLTVRAGPLAHPADIGREVVAAIKQFEKRSGKGWRTP